MLLCKELDLDNVEYDQVLYISYKYRNNLQGHFVLDKILDLCPKLNSSIQFVMNAQ